MKSTEVNDINNGWQVAPDETSCASPCPHKLSVSTQKYKETVSLYYQFHFLLLYIMIAITTSPIINHKPNSTLMAQEIMCTVCGSSL